MTHSMQAMKQSPTVLERKGDEHISKKLLLTLQPLVEMHVLLHKSALVPSAYTIYKIYIL